MSESAPQSDTVYVAVTTGSSVFHRDPECVAFGPDTQVRSKPLNVLPTYTACKRCVR